MDANQTKSPLWLLIVAWLIVGVPAAWGMEQTVYKSFDLFRGTTTALNASATQPAR